MNAFSGTASYYRRFRPVIPDELARLLDQTAPTASPRRLLDIGTGPGTVVHALLPYFDDVIAVDADVAMLVEAEGVLRPDLPPTHRLQIRHAFAEDFVPPDGWRPQLVTCGRVFHWLDQPRFLERLDEYVAPEASSPYSAIAVCGRPAAPGSRLREQSSRSSSVNSGMRALARSRHPARRTRGCCAAPPSRM